MASSGRCRGFTLTELMVVVIIVAVLALLGTAAVRGYATRSRTAEGASMVQAIRAAQEAYRAEAGTYLDVSSSVTTWYPRAIPDAQLHAWNESGHTDFARWQALNPTAPGQGVRMVYVTVAGPPGAPIPALSTNDAIAWPTPTRDWYIVEARGDVDGDGQFSHYAAGSLTPELYFENTD